MAVNGQIDIFTFSVLNPLDEFDPPAHRWQDITEPWEDGIALSRMGRQAAPSRLYAVADLAANTRFALLENYKGLVDLGLPVTIQRRVGLTIEFYYNMLIRDVQHVTQTPFVAVASGGLTAGNFVIETIWTVQYALGS